jgi:hypothetical protein
MQDLYVKSATTPEFSPEAMQKILQYQVDNAVMSPLWAGSRGDVIKSNVKDSGFYTLQAWPGWKPGNTWLDK